MSSCVAMRSIKALDYRDLSVAGILTYFAPFFSSSGV